MAGHIDIINRALSKLGENRITSLDDNCKAAALAQSIYPMLRDQEISSHNWGFARKRTMLPTLSEKPLFGFPWAYLLPSDCLRVIEAGSWPAPQMADLINAPNQSYTIENGQILSYETPPLCLVYLARVEDVALYPPVFSETLASHLAYEMAESLTGSQNKKEGLWREYDLTLKKAKRWGAINLAPQSPQDNTWLWARY